MTKHCQKLFAVLLTGFLLSACATITPGSLSDLKRQQIRQLTLKCYSASEGLRVVAGGLETWTACRDWAVSQI